MGPKTAVNTVVVPSVARLNKALALIGDDTQRSALYEIAKDLDTINDIAHESTADLVTMVVVNALRDISRRHADEGLPFWTSQVTMELAESLIFDGAVCTSGSKNGLFGGWMQTAWLNRSLYMQTIGRDYRAYVHDVLVPETSWVASFLDDEIPAGLASRGMPTMTKAIRSGARSFTAPYLLRFKRRLQATRSLGILKSKVESADPEQTDAALHELRKVFARVCDYEDKIAKYCTQEFLSPSGQDAYMTLMYGPCLTASWKSVSSPSAGGERFVKTSARGDLEKEHMIVRVIRTDCKDPDIGFSADLKGMLEYAKSGQFEDTLACMWADKLGSFPSLIAK